MTKRGQIDPRYARTVERIRNSFIRRGGEADEEEEEEPDLATLAERNMRIAEALGAQSWIDRTEELRSYSDGRSGGRTKYVRKIRFTRECGSCGSCNNGEEHQEEGNAHGPSLVQAVQEYFNTGNIATNMSVEESVDEVDEESERVLARKMLSQPAPSAPKPPVTKEPKRNTKEYEEHLARETAKLMKDMEEIKLRQQKREEEENKKRVEEDRIKEEKEKKRLEERQKIVDAAMAERIASGNTDTDFVIYVFYGKAYFLRASPLPETLREEEGERCVLKSCPYHPKNKKPSSGSRY